MRDGMSITQVEQPINNQSRETVRQERVEQIITSRAGRDMYAQALANPTDPMDMSGQ